MPSFVQTLLAWGPGGVLILAVLDSAGIPIPTGVDALVVYLSANNPARAWLVALIAVLGSLAGNLILFYLARKGGEAYLDRHSLSPRARRFRVWFQYYGLLTIFIPALLPIPLPLKIFVLSAGALGVHTAGFIGVILAARIPRYAGLAYLGVKLGQNSLAFFRQNALWLTAAGVVLFVLLYLAVRWKGARSRAALERQSGAPGAS